MACRMVVSGSRDGEEEPGGGRRRGFQGEEQAAHLHGEAEVAQFVHAETAGGEFVTCLHGRQKFTRRQKTSEAGICLISKMFKFKVTLLALLKTTLCLI